MTMSGIQHKYSPRYTVITTGTHTVAAGAAGWVDTDVSATTGTNTRRLWVVACTVNAAPGLVGARPVGSALVPAAWANYANTILTHVSSTGHVELLRDAANNNRYDFVGYFE